MSETKFKWDRIVRAFSGEPSDRLLAEREKKVRAESTKVHELEKQPEEQDIKDSDLQTMAAKERQRWDSVKNLATNKEKGELLESIKLNLRSIAQVGPNMVRLALESLEGEINTTRQQLNEANRKLDEVTHPAMADPANQAKQQIGRISEMVAQQGKVMTRTWLRDQQVEMLDLATSVVSRAAYLTTIDALLGQADILLNGIKVNQGNEVGRKIQEMESNLMICRRFRDQIVITTAPPAIENLGQKTALAVQNLIEQLQYQHY